MSVAKARLEAKVNPEIYQLLKQAAAVTGRTLTDFVISVAYEEAKKTISEHQTIQLSIQDQHLLVEHLNASFEPNPSMKEALKLHSLYLSQKASKND